MPLIRYVVVVFQSEAEPDYCSVNPCPSHAHGFELIEDAEAFAEACPAWMQAHVLTLGDSDACVPESFKIKNEESSTVTPTIGRIVLYTLTEDDATEINRRRSDFELAEPGHTGFQGHVGNRAEAGQQYPAVVVRLADFPGHEDICNLKVMLDGTDGLWACSRGEGTGNGTWMWPPRV